MGENQHSVSRNVPTMKIAGIPSDASFLCKHLDPRRCVFPQIKDGNNAETHQKLWKSLRRYEIWNFPTFVMTSTKTWTKGILLFVWGHQKLVLLTLIGFKERTRKRITHGKHWNWFPALSKNIITCTERKREHENEKVLHFFKHSIFPFALNTTVFALPGSSRFHKSSTTSCTSVIFYPFVSLRVELEAIPPQKELRTELTFEVLYPLVRCFTITSRVVTSKHFPTSNCSARDLSFTSVQCQVILVLLL